MASKWIYEHDIVPDEDIGENRNIAIEQEGLLNQASKTLQRPGYEILLNICADVFGILSWAGMLAFGATLWYFNGTLVKDLGFSVDHLLNTARPLSTLFSIIFAATFGRVLRSFALWQLERGSKIGLLDQLIGSTSVSSALMTQLSAGLKRSIALYTIGIAIIMLWLLSPLGSQAVLRILSIGTVTTAASVSLPYLNVSNWNVLPGSGSDGQLALIAPNTLLNAALISPIDTKSAPQDSWNHVKIPQLSRMSSGRADPDGWYQVTANSADDFSSLVGIPIGYPPQSDHRLWLTNLSLESWYWDLECSPWQPANSNTDPTFESFQQNSFVNNGRSEDYFFPAFVIYYNDSTHGGNRATETCNINFSSLRTSVIDCPELGVREVGIKIQGTDPIRDAKCQIRTLYVETEIFCSDRKCVPKRIRESKLHHLQSNWTMLDIWTGTSVLSNTVPSLFFNNFASSIAGRRDGGGGSNAMAGYIDDPSDPFRSSFATPDLQKVDDKLITSRFTQIMNTYWLVSVGSQLMTSGNGDFETSSQFNFGTTEKTNLTSIALATISTTDDRLQCSVVWLTIFMLVTMIAFAAAVCGLAIIMMSRGPRLAMNISTVIRDNRYCARVSKGSYLDDNERSRKWQNLTVRIGDVNPSEGVGHIAISTAGTGDTTIVDRLRKRRLYD